MNVPETRYAKTADGVHVAYQVIGDGPVDMVYVMGWITNIDAMWEEPNLRRCLTRLSSFCRLILFDKRGVGLSDRVSEDRLPSLETRMDDVRAVMDAAGSERAIVFGVSEGGPMSLLFAATYPERTVGLILFGARADYSARDQTKLDAYDDIVSQSWGTIELAREDIREWAAPSHTDQEGLARWLASYLRRGASPGAAIALHRMNREINVTEALSAIHVPTLVMRRTGDRNFSLDDMKEVAAKISGARFVELSGDAHFFWIGDSDAVLDEIENFVSGIRDTERAFDRVLTTVLFTDIVDSTAQTAALGDARWHEIHNRHDKVVDTQVSRFRGRRVRSTGDGILAVFDGPARAVHCAKAIVESVQSLGIEVRAGIHTGEVELRGDDIAGIAVAIGARIGALAGPSEVLVSQTIRDLVAGSGLVFEDAGKQNLKGVPEHWRVYRVAAN